MNILYTLPHGIRVVGEYSARGCNPYVRVRIIEHPMFDSKVYAGYQHIRKSRAVMTSIIGRRLLRSELVHHKNEDRTDDSPDNLEIITPRNHNKHHKIGCKHHDESKRKISEGLKLAIKEGRRDPQPPPDWNGKKHSESSKEKISRTRKRLIADGKIEKPVPKVMRGEASGMSKFTEQDVIEIRQRVKEGESVISIAKEYFVVHQSIYNIINRITWRHIQ